MNFSPRHLHSDGQKELKEKTVVLNKPPRFKRKTAEICGFQFYSIKLSADLSACLRIHTDISRLLGSCLSPGDLFIKS